MASPKATPATEPVVPTPVTVVAPQPATVQKEVAPVAKEPGTVKPVNRNVLTTPKKTDVVQGIKRDRH